jgi:hypothetical protein
MSLIWISSVGVAEPRREQQVGDCRDTKQTLHWTLDALRPMTHVLDASDIRSGRECTVDDYMSKTTFLARVGAIIIDGYVIEGHVPATIVRKLLKERPSIRGISLPGMPDGSPGMTGQKTEPFVVYEFGDSGSKVFAQE